MNELRVEQQSAEVQAMAAQWAITDPLMVGTAAMRAAGGALLPRWPAEEQDAYNLRLKTATLFPAFKRTVSVMAGKPFSKELTFGTDVPTPLLNQFQNCDLQGKNLHAFAAEIFTEALSAGFAGVMVDMPKRPDWVKTIHDENQIGGLRPYLIYVRHDSILGWKSAQQQNGSIQLTQLRIAECAEIDNGEFGRKQVNRVRVLETVAGANAIYRIFEEDADHKFVEIDGGALSIPFIPFVPFYGRQIGFMIGQSPLLDLAFLNVRHWQEASDQATLMHTARVPILVATTDEEGFRLVIGGGTVVRLPKDCDLKYVEHTGKAIQAGAEALEALEAQMIHTGAELLVQRPAEPKSATQSNNDAEANKSELQRLVESFEDSLDLVLQYWARWLNLPEGGHISLFKDFSTGSLSDASAQLLVTMQQAKIISRKTVLMEQQRRGVLSPDIDPDAEIAAADGETTAQ